MLTCYSINGDDGDDGGDAENQTPHQHDITCAPMTVVGDGKYVVFKLEDFFRMMGQLALPPWWIQVDDNDCPVEHIYGDTDWRPSSREGFHEHMEGTDWDCAPLAEEITKVANQYAIGDATVLRDQDVFTPGTLHAYANSILTAVELTQAFGMDNSDVLRSLRAKADFFHGRATRAERSPWRKVPD